MKIFAVIVLSAIFMCGCRDRQAEEQRRKAEERKKLNKK